MKSLNIKNWIVGGLVLGVMIAIKVMTLLMQFVKQAQYDYGLFY